MWIEWRERGASSSIPIGSVLASGGAELSLAIEVPAIQNVGKWYSTIQHIDRNEIQENNIRCSWSTLCALQYIILGLGVWGGVSWHCMVGYEMLSCWYRWITCKLLYNINHFFAIANMPSRTTTCTQGLCHHHQWRYENSLHQGNILWDFTSNAEASWYPQPRSGRW